MFTLYACSIVYNNYYKLIIACALNEFFVDVTAYREER